MSDVTIVVKGPGGVIDNEALLIKEFLESKGATVTLENPHEHTDKPWRDCDGQQITIKVEGQPWGG